MRQACEGTGTQLGRAANDGVRQLSGRFTDAMWSRDRAGVPLIDHEPFPLALASDALPFSNEAARVSACPICVASHHRGLQVQRRDREVAGRSRSVSCWWWVGEGGVELRF